MKRILIVDDSIELGRTLQDALKLTYPDTPITVVPSAEEALLESTRLTIDLLVTDLRLPGMSGFDLIRKIRVRQPNIKIMLITGLSLDERQTAQKDELHPDAFMRKPISTIAFLDTVASLFAAAERPSAAVVADTKPIASIFRKPVLEPETAPGKSQLAPERSQAAPERSQAALKQSEKKDDKQFAEEALLKELAAVLPGEPAEPKPATKKATGGLAITSDTPPASQPEDGGLSGILSRLRGSLGALLAMLLDERGHPVAQAGDIPDIKLEEHIISPIMASLSAAAKISFQLSQSGIAPQSIAQSVQAYKGADLELVAAPVGQYVLMLALKPSRSTLRLAIAFEEVLNAQGELVNVLEAMGLHVQSLMEFGSPAGLMAELSAAEEAGEEIIPPEILETPLGQDLSLEKFEALFAQKKTGQLHLEDPDAFWDTAAKVEKPDSNPGMLTFEQAQKLGLLPPEGGG